jgi:hypothetical protein
MPGYLPSAMAAYASLAKSLQSVDWNLLQEALMLARALCR